MDGIDAFLAGIQTNPVAYSEFTSVEEAGSSLFALYSAAGDTITPGTATGSQILQDFASYITNQETLLATLSSLAANVPGASAWATPEILLLQSTINAELSLLYSNSGSIDGLTESAALSEVPLSSGAPAVPSTLAGIASAASGNVASGPNIDQIGYENEGVGTWLDAMGIFNIQHGTYLLAIGSFNVENGTYDVAVGNSNTISGTNDTALGNNDTIVGDNARIFGSGLSASSGQTVFGTASSYIVINADGTWSTVTNGVASAGVGNAENIPSLMAVESAAMGSAEGVGLTNYANLSAEFAALGYSQAVGSFSADMGLRDFGLWDFAGSTTASAGIISTDAAATLSAWGSTSSVLELATLSALVAQYGSSTVRGADAVVVIEAMNAGIDPAPLVSQLLADLANPSITSSTTMVGNVSAQDRANNNLVIAEYQASDWSAMVATLSVLAMSSNTVIASIAGAEMIVTYASHGSAALNGTAAIESLEGGSTTFATDIALLGSAEASTLSLAVTWTGSTFQFSGSKYSGSTLPPYSGLSSADAADIAILNANPWGATTSTLDLSTLSDIAARDGTSTVLGADAEVALELASANADPTQAIGLVESDAANPKITSSTTTLGHLSPLDRAYVLDTIQENLAGNWGAFDVTFSALAVSSNPVISGIAALGVEYGATGNLQVLDINAMQDYLNTGSFQGTAMSAIAAELSSATGSIATWTGSNFAFAGIPISAADKAAGSQAVYDWYNTLAQIKKNNVVYTTSVTVSDLLAIVLRDGTSTVIGADAQAVITVISAQADPSSALAQLQSDLNNPNITEGQTSISGISAVDRANAEAAVGILTDKDTQWGFLVTTLSSLATSSDPYVASMASAELAIFNNQGDIVPGLTAIYDYTHHLPPPPASVMYTFSQQLAKATASNGAAKPPDDPFGK